MRVVRPLLGRRRWRPSRRARGTGAADDTWDVPARHGSRSRVTATATVTACRSTAPRVPRGGPDLPRDRGLLLPGTSWGRQRAGSGWSSPATPPTTSSSGRGPGLTLRDAGTGESTVLPDNGATRWRIAVDRQGRTGSPTSPSAGGAPRPHRRGRVRCRRRGGHPRDAVGEPGVPAAGAGRRLGTRSTSSASRTTSRAWCPWRCRRLEPAAVRAQAVAARTYAAYERAHRDRAALRHLVVPGLRRLRRRAPRLQRRGRRHPQAGPAARRRAGLHAVRLEQRRLDLGGLRALPRRGRGPVRRLGWQPGPRLVGAGRGHPDRDVWPGIGNLRRITVTGATATATGADGCARSRSWGTGAGWSSAATPSAPRSDCAPPGLRSWSGSAPPPAANFRARPCVRHHDERPTGTAREGETPCVRSGRDLSVVLAGVRSSPPRRPRGPRPARASRPPSSAPPDPTPWRAPPSGT